MVVFRLNAFFRTSTHVRVWTVATLLLFVAVVPARANVPGAPNTAFGKFGRIAPTGSSNGA